MTIKPYTFRKPTRCPACAIRRKPNSTMQFCMKLWSTVSMVHWRFMCHYCGNVHTIKDNRFDQPIKVVLEDWTVPIQSELPF